jgi:hypothetical protein
MVRLTLDWAFSSEVGYPVPPYCFSQRWCRPKSSNLPRLADHSLLVGSCVSTARLVLPARKLLLMLLVNSCVSLAAVNSSVLVLMDWVLLRAVRLAAVMCKLAGWFRYAECVNVFRCTLMLSLSHNSCTSAIHTMLPSL